MTAAGPVEIKLLDDGMEPAWDAYVLTQPKATFFHRAPWRRVIERGFGHRAIFLYAERGGRIVGILPLYHVRSMLFGSALVSTAYGVYGGPVADSDGVLVLFYDRAVALAKELGVGHVEFRSSALDRQGWKKKEGLYATFRREIGPDNDKNLQAIPRKQRAVVRQSLETGLEPRTAEDVDLNYDLYALNVRNHGTPVFSRKYFRALKHEFGAACEVLNIYKGNEAVAGCLTFYHRDEILPYYAGGTPRAREFKAHDFMYWDLIRRGAERGCRVFDFGRSKVGTGPFSFKKNWGFAPTPLVYDFYLNKAREVPDVNPLNPKYRMFVSLWQKLPLPVANAVGPIIARGLA
jgi:FemAB-related protein (PEP-CTERM system-associated)